MGDNLPQTPLPAIIVPIKPRAQKKRKQAKRDTTTELSSRFIAEGLKDCSDIMLTQGRSSIAFTKRSKLNHRQSEAGPPSLLSFGSGLSGLCCGGPLSLAPELLGAFSRTHTLAQQKGVELQEEV